MEALQTYCQETKSLFHTTNQAKICLHASVPKLKYGFEVPKGYTHGVILDNKNNYTKWQDITKLSMKQQDDYQTFDALSLHTDVPEGFKKIRFHLIFDVKHEGRHKAKVGR